MRIAMVVVTALLCTTAVAAAEDQGTQGDGLFCSDRCDANYESCMRWRRGKGTGDCPGAFVRCRDACASPAARAAAKRAEPPPPCRDACQVDFDHCMKRDNGRHTDTCAKAVMVCRNGCPPEAPPAATEASAPPAARADESQHAPPVTPPAAAAAAPAPPAAAAPAQPAAPAPAAANARADEHEPQRAAAPPAGNPRSADAIGPAAGKVPPSTPPRSKRVKTAGGVGATTSIAATADHAPSSAVAVPASDGGSRRPSAWSRAWCALTGSCGSRVVKGPVSCDDACTESYTACIAHEDPKRGGDCATSSLRCHQDCGQRKTSAGTAP